MATDFESLSVRTVQPDECDAADGQWETDNEPDTDLPDPSDAIPFDPCFFDPDGFLCSGSNNPPGSGGPYCRFNCTCVSVDGSFGDPDSGGGGFPPGGGTGGPTLCVDDPHSPLRCDWFPALLIDPVSRTRTQGSASNTRGDCDHRWECHWDCYDSPPPGGGSGGPSTRDLPTFIGDGPGLLMVRPRPGWVVSGTIPVAVTVDHRIDTTELLGIVVDGVPVTLSDTYAGAEAIGICEQDVFDDPDCPFIGFGGMLDTRQLSDGTHQLVAIARRNGPDEGFLTWVETTIEVRNQTSPSAPQIHVAESWGSHAHMPIEGHFSFGTRDLDDLPLVATYFVCNLGNDTLTLLNHGTMVTGEGFGRNVTGPAGRIAPLRCSQLGVRFEASEPGFYNGVVDIQSDDPDQPSFTFTLDGVVTSSDPDLDWYLDSNASFAWEGIPPDDYSRFGIAGTTPVVGDWNGDGVSDFGTHVSGSWQLDLNGNGTWDGCMQDQCATFGLDAADVPVVGDWNGDGRDEIGVFHSGSWLLDENGDFTWNGAPETFGFGLPGDAPLVGDWNGDGRDDLGLVRSGQWFIDLNGNRAWDGCSVDPCFQFGLAGDVPIAGDWNGDGLDEVGAFHQGSWLLDMNGNLVWDGSEVWGFGLPEDLPVVGDWQALGVDSPGLVRLPVPF